MMEVCGPLGAEGGQKKKKDDDQVQALYCSRFEYSVCYHVQVISLQHDSFASLTSGTPLSPSNPYPLVGLILNQL